MLQNIVYLNSAFLRIAWKLPVYLKKKCFTKLLFYVYCDINTIQSDLMSNVVIIEYSTDRNFNYSSSAHC